MTKILPSVLTFISENPLFSGLILVIIGGLFGLYLSKLPIKTMISRQIDSVYKAMIQ